MKNASSETHVPARESTALVRVAWPAFLLGLVFLGWCAGNGKWTPAAWRYPTAYTEPEKGDVVHALAMMKAGANGEFLPLGWKGAKDLGAPFEANWNDWPLVEEVLVVLFSGLGSVFGLFLPTSRRRRRFTGLPGLKTARGCARSSPHSRMDWRHSFLPSRHFTSRPSTSGMCRSSCRFGGGRPRPQASSGARESSGMP